MKSSMKSMFYGEEMFFRGEHPDKRSGKEWVAYMNKKYPDLNWGIRKKDRKNKPTK